MYPFFYKFIFKGCLGFYFLGVLGVVFFFFPRMALSLCPPLVQNTPCLHYFGLYILGNLSRHVKSVHPFDNLIPHANQAIFSL